MDNSLAWLGETIPSAIWSVVRWIAFFFKLASLAFIVPIIGLIAFDFGIWLWRLYRPSRPADSSRSSRRPGEYVQHPSSVSPKGPSTAVDSATKPMTSKRRAVFESTNG